MSFFPFHVISVYFSSVIPSKKYLCEVEGFLLKLSLPHGHIGRARV